MPKKFMFSKYLLFFILISILNNYQLNAVGRFTNFSYACSITSVLLSALLASKCSSMSQTEMDTNKCLIGAGIFSVSLPVFFVFLGNECEKSFGYLDFQEIKSDLKEIGKNELISKLEKENGKNVTNFSDAVLESDSLEKEKTLIDKIGKSFQEIENYHQWIDNEEYQNAKETFEKYNKYILEAQNIIKKKQNNCSSDSDLPDYSQGISMQRNALQLTDTKKNK